MKTAVKPVSILIARFLCVEFRITLLGLIDIATKISPASAAAHHEEKIVPLIQHKKTLSSKARMGWAWMLRI
jgi:hypothetical protein